MSNLPLTGGSLEPRRHAVLHRAEVQQSETGDVYLHSEHLRGRRLDPTTFPTANAGPDQTVATGATVALDGTQSTDIDGNALTYRWSFVSVPDGSHAVLTNPTAVNPNFVVDTAGEYTVQLIANDGRADSVPATVAISTDNSRPVANAGADQLVASGAPVHLDGTHSTDIDGDPLTYQWNLTSIPAGSQASARCV